jgi:1-acyl-sn-glycerol-3-phosphate acyltransferase
MGDPAAITSEAERFERRTLRGRPRKVVRATILGIVTPLVRLRLVNIERVPPSGAVLVVSNHLHNADPILLNAAYPRPVHFMAKKEAFGVPIIPWFLRLAGSFPVDRGKSDRTAIKNAQARLAAGIAVGIYPEGTRSPTRALQQAHSGAGLLALAANTPVQPVVITGSERLPMNGSKGKAAAAAGIPWPKRDHRGVRILFGEPFFVPREIDGRRVTSDEATEIIMVEIARLLPPDYRGVYAQALEAETRRRALPFPR